jgi:hypothetical protein
VERNNQVDLKRCLTRFQECLGIGLEQNPIIATGTHIIPCHAVSGENLQRDAGFQVFRSFSLMGLAVHGNPANSRISPKASS